MKLLVPVVALGLSALGCDDMDTNMTSNDAGSNMMDAGMMDSGASNTPAPPTLGVQLDRGARAAISTALIMPVGDNPAKDMRKDGYNAATPDQWAGYKADIEGALGIYDSLDATCGNQFAVATASTAAGAYDALATVLVNDVLLVNMGSGTCDQYLAVEAGVAADCGGRHPKYDVIDTTYSVLAIGALSGVGDTVDSDDMMHPSAFPYLAAP